MPKLGAKDEHEQQLATFLRKLQNLCARGALPRPKRQQLLEVPGMPLLLERWAAYQPQQHRFEDCLRRLSAWVETHGQLPKQGSKDRSELALGRFINRQQV